MKKKNRKSAEILKHYVLPAVSIVLCVIVVILSKQTEQKAESTPEPTDTPLPIEESTEITPEPIYTSGPVEGVEYPVVVASEETIAASCEGDGNTGSSSPFMTPMYSNGDILEYSFISGGRFTLGAQVPDTDSIILSPVYYPAEDEIVPLVDVTPFGFYITADDGMIEYSPDTPGTYDSGNNFNLGNYYITDHTYDTVVPSAFADSTYYGIRWTNPYAGTTPQNTVNLSIRIVRIFDGTLIGVLRAEIVYDEGNGGYRLYRVYNGDVSSTGELGYSERAEMVNAATLFIRDSRERMQQTSFALEDWETASDEAIVERVTSTYFRKVFDESGNVQSAGKYRNCYIYAVNIPYVGAGFITVYFAPDSQLMGFTQPVFPGNTEINYEILGYDPYYPFSKNTLYVPAFQQDEYFN